MAVHRLPTRQIPYSLFFLYLFLAPCVLATPTQLSLQLPPALMDQAESDVELVLTRLGTSSEEEPASITIKARAHGDVEFDLPSETTWRLTLDSDRFWTPPREIISASETSEGAEIPIRIYPAGVLTGEVRVPKTDAVPTELALRIQPAEGRAWGAEFACPITEGRIQCTVPTVGLDLRFSLPPYISHYFWDVQLTWKETKDLGRLIFRPGASVIGWVDHSDGSTDFAKTQVTLSPLVAGVASRPEPEQRYATVDLETEVNARGFFQFQGVPPGSYGLTARHPRFSQARISPLLVLEGEEHEVEFIELWPLATLEVDVTPPKDPFHQPWEVRLHRTGSDPNYLGEIRRGPVPDSGTWKAEGLEHGAYALSVRDSRGNVWAREQTQVRTSLVSHRVEVQTTRLEVRFLLGDTTIRNANVTFKNLKGGSHDRKTNEEGIAYVFLQRDHRWQIEIRKPEEGIWGRFRDIEVPERELSARWPRLELQLPDTEIFGEVLLDQQPLAQRAVIDVHDGAESAQLETDLDGTFVFRGIQPDEPYLQAQLESDKLGSLRSAPARVPLEEGVPFGPLLFHLEPQKELQGLVVSPAGQGVAGALVMAFPEESDPSGGLATPPQGYTDVDGVFELQVPRYLERMRVLVFPLGFAATQQTITLSGEAPIIPVSSEGGALVVTYSDSGEEAVTLGDEVIHTTVWSDGLVGTGFILSHWASLNQIVQEAGELFVPMLEPGPYSVCLGPSVSMAPTRIGAECSEGFVSPGGELHIELSP